MASLSKNGNELARLTVYSTMEDSVSNRGTLSVRNEFSYRSNGALLSKLTIDGHSYGWKLAGKFKPETRRDFGRLKAAVVKHAARKAETAEALGHSFDLTSVR